MFDALPAHLGRAHEGRIWLVAGLFIDVLVRWLAPPSGRYVVRTSFPT